MKGFAPVLLGVFVLVFALLVGLIYSIGGTKEYDRSTNDAEYQNPINAMEIIEKEMKQALLFSIYQGSANILLSGGIDNYMIGPQPSYPVRDNTATLYWYDTRRNPTEVYPDGSIVRGMLANNIQNIMQLYVIRAGTLMEKIGDWDFPSSNSVTVVMDGTDGRAYNYSADEIKYESDKIELSGISALRSMWSTSPLLMFDIGIDGTSCFIANEHIADCTTIVPAGFKPLRTKVKECMIGLPTSASVTQQSGCGGSGYPIISDQDVLNSIGAVESTIEQCVSAEVKNNENVLDNTFKPHPVNWGHVIYQNDASSSVSNCNNIDVESVCTSTKTQTDDETYLPPFLVAATPGPTGYGECSRFTNNPNHFCNTYFPGSVATSCFYITGPENKWIWDPSNPPSYQGLPVGDGPGVSSITCTKTETITVTQPNYIRTRTCDVDYNIKLDLTTNVTDKNRQYPFLSYTQNPSGETSYKDLALRYLVYIEENYP